MKTIIGITGGMRSGKSLAADILAEYYTNNFDSGDYRRPVYIICFADILRDIVSDITDIDPYSLNKQDIKNSKVNMKDMPDETYRDMLKGISKQLKDRYPNIIKSVWKRKVEETEDNAIIITPDARMPDEAYYLSKEGGVLVKIKRPFSYRFPEMSHAEYNVFDYDENKLSPEYKKLLSDPTEIESEKIVVDFVIENYEKNAFENSLKRFSSVLFNNKSLFID